jgi:hypothetical protein
MSNASTPSVPCDLCGDATDREDCYCSGCESYICERHPGDPWGSHDPMDHVEDEDAEGVNRRI